MSSKDGKTGGAEQGKTGHIWRQPDGNPVSCVEKIKVLKEFLDRGPALYETVARLLAAEPDATVHEALVEALTGGDPSRAADLMDEHLRHIERGLDIRDAVEEPVDIRSVFVK